jgi:hypothetical protein
VLQGDTAKATVPGKSDTRNPLYDGELYRLSLRVQPVDTTPSIQLIRKYFP